MNEKSKMQKASLQFRGPAIYRIVVQGNLSASKDAWQDIRSKIAITSSDFEEASNTFSLQVHVSDQAGLAGVFNTLYELHIPIMDVEYLGSNKIDRKPIKNEK